MSACELRSGNSKKSNRTKQRDELERCFSIELESKTSLKNATLASSEKNGGVLVEGTIGGLRSAGFVDGVIFEVVGTKGALSINLAEKDIGPAKPAETGRGRTKGPKERPRGFIGGEKS